MNDRGEVLFTNIGGSRIIISDGITQNTVATSSDPAFAIFRNGGINDLGHAVFIAVRDDGITGVFVYDGNTITEIVNEISDARFSTILNRVEINNNEEIIFLARSGTGVEGVYFWGGGEIETIVDTTGAFVQIALGFDAFNDYGEVAYFARTVDGERLIVADDGATQIIIRDGEYIKGPPGGINNDGFVVFREEKRGQDGTIRVKVISSTGTKLSLLSQHLTFFTPQNNASPQAQNEFIIPNAGPLNNVGEMLSLGSIRTGEPIDPAAVFIVSGVSKLQLVVTEGDTIDGRELINLVRSFGYINDSGQIAFHARFDDGFFRIYRADP